MRLILNSVETQALAAFLQHESPKGCELVILAGEDGKAGIEIYIADLIGVIVLQSPSKVEK